jgi:putative membrane protein
MEFVGLLIGILLGALVSAVIIWIVGKLGLGLEVSGFGAAFIAAIVIAIVAGVINWLLGLLGIGVAAGWLGAIIQLIISAVVLLVSDRFVKGLKVNGFTGALIAAVAIGAVAWLLSWVVGLIV